MDFIITTLKCAVCLLPGSLILDRFYEKNGEFIKQFFIKLPLFWGGCAYAHWVM